MSSPSAPPPPANGARVEVALGVVGLAFWAVWGEPSALALLLCYGLAWLAANVAAALRRSPPLPERRAVFALLLLLVAAAPAARLVDRAEDFSEREAIDGIDHAVASRLRLQHTPSLAPPLVAADRPQAFLLWAPGGERATVSFGGDPLVAAPLGGGLFRVSYDPRRDGSPTPAEGPLEAAITVDGSTSRRTLTAVTPLAHPRELRVAPDGAYAVAVSEETDALYRVDADGVVFTAEVGDGPTDAAVDGARVAVVHRYGSELRWYDAATGAPRGDLDVGPFGRSVDARDGRVVIARGGSAPELVLVEEGEVRQRIELDAVPDRARFGRTSSEIVVSLRRGARLLRFTAEPIAASDSDSDTASVADTASVSDTASDTASVTDTASDSDSDPASDSDSAPVSGGWPRFVISDEIALGRPAVTFATRPGDARLLVAVTDLRTDGEPHLGNHFVSDQLVTIDLERWAIVERRPTATRTPRQDNPGNVDRGLSPSAIQLVDRGLWVAFAGSDDVWWMPDGAPPEVIELDLHPLATPLGVARLADGSVLVSSGVYGAFGTFDAEGEHRANHRLAPGDRQLLAEGRERELQRRIGERTFYEGTRSGISCQSCHLHAESDLGQHNIGGKTLVSTLDVRGLLGTPPYLRDGGYPTLGSLNELSQTLYRGYRREQGGRTLCLDVYLSDLPRALPAGALEGRDAERERRGFAAFERARCSLCHAPPAFTNLGQHPTGALFPRFAEGHAEAAIDTPSLLNLGASAPYLLDGRAETLDAIWAEHDPARRHGDHGRLSAAEQADLRYFLEGL